MADLCCERESLCEMIAEQSLELQQLNADNEQLNRIISDAHHVIRHNLQVCRPCRTTSLAASCVKNRGWNSKL